ncbi:hypothetical protein ACFFLS_03980 [Flavobacterium procerum]|uniref:Uncharacterized protein n=1 Tax=Flavobacterium procerum TaxID=1455569 RepID=A0ABV6BNJ7_9FLAO
MESTIKLRVRKEIDNGSEFKVIKLKGSLIAGGFTEIIHISDEDEHYYLNTFSTPSRNKKSTEEFLLGYIADHQLNDAVMLLK